MLEDLTETIIKVETQSERRRQRDGQPVAGDEIYL